MVKQRATVFWNGRSQAVRLPKEFRVKGSHLKIKKKGNQVILSPIDDEDWPEEFWQCLDQFSKDFERSTLPTQERGELF